VSLYRKSGLESVRKSKAAVPHGRGTAVALPQSEKLRHREPGSQYRKSELGSVRKIESWRYRGKLRLYYLRAES
jgi:hypothetical protein